MIPGARTPQSGIVVIPDGRRTIVHHPGTVLFFGADSDFDPEWVHVDHVAFGKVSGRLSVDAGNPIDHLDLTGVALYAPTDEQRWKVYIVDEAHMLTREAWNALLKVLEEPPPRVIFVFATTEPQKIQQAAPTLERRLPASAKPPPANRAAESP